MTDIEERLACVLRQYEDSHASHHTLQVTNEAGTTGVDERIECGCQLCKDARIVLADAVDPAEVKSAEG